MTASAPPQQEASGLSQRAGAWAGVAAALAISLALLWFITKEPLVVAGFGAGTLVLGAIALLLSRRGEPARELDLALPDWSVTVAAIERPDTAVAITDRANRLVCANSRYGEWFGDQVAPPRLPVDDASLERLARAARTGWRDGFGRADLVEGPAGRWSAEVDRSGRAEDYLVWRLARVEASDPVGDLVRHLDG